MVPTGKRTGKRFTVTRACQLPSALTEVKRKGYTVLCPPNLKCGEGHVPSILPKIGTMTLL